MAAQTFDPEQYKQHQQMSWGAAAETYGTQMVRFLTPLTERVLALLAPQAGQKILDVASGPGEPALSIAKALNGTGQVIGTDLAEGMVAQARKRAQAAGVKNIEFRQMDAEALQFSDGFFDGVTCRLGLMIFPHPHHALQEMQRVLTPGGKAVVVVWGSEEKAGLTQLFRQVTEEYFPQTKIPGAPSPFAFGQPTALKQALTKAGFVKVQTQAFTVTPSFAQPENLWNAFRDGSPLKVLLAQASADAVAQAREAFLKQAEHSRSTITGRIEVPSEAVLAVGLKA